MMMNLKKNFFITWGLIALTSCAVGPDYQRPPVETPLSYKERSDWSPALPQDGIDRGLWWSVYHDAVLDDLMKQIDVSNQNLKAAEAAWRQAKAITDETQATLFPTLTLNSSGSRSGSGQIKPVNTVNAGAGASWDVDVWGSIRRTLESDVANAEASEADLANARLSAQAQLATDYFSLRVQDELKRLLIATAEADKKSLAIVKNQYDAGVAAKSDVLAADTQVQSIEASAINADVKRSQFEHAIAVLIGKPPAALTLTANHFAYHLPNIPPTLPSTILERRPDIAASERAVAAANAQIGVETAAWFPNLTLSATYGYSAQALSKLFQASNSLWSLGPTLAETVFDAGARSARIRGAEASYDESVANYRQTVLTAFQQVEDQLAALRILAEQAKTESMAVKEAREAEILTLNQYKEGTVPFTNVIIAQTNTLANEQNALGVTSSQLTANIALIEALGGGWTTQQLSSSH